MILQRLNSEFYLSRVLSERILSHARVQAYHWVQE